MQKCNVSYFFTIAMICGHKADLNQLLYCLHLFCIDHFNPFHLRTWWANLVAKVAITFFNCPNGYLFPQHWFILFFYLNKETFHCKTIVCSYFEMGWNNLINIYCHLLPLSILPTLKPKKWSPTTTYLYWSLTCSKKPKTIIAKYIKKHI